MWGGIYNVERRFFASICYAPCGAGRSMLRPYEPRGSTIRAIRADAQWAQCAVNKMQIAKGRHTVPSCVRSMLRPYWG